MSLKLNLQLMKGIKGIDYQGITETEKVGDVLRYFGFGDDCIE